MQTTSVDNDRYDLRFAAIVPAAPRPSSTFSTCRFPSPPARTRAIPHIHTPYDDYDLYISLEQDHLSEPTPDNVSHGLQNGGNTR